MAKLKTNKGVKKRFKVTKKKKVLKNKAFKGHLLTKKAKSRKRKLRRKDTLAGAAEAKTIRKLLPYG